MSVWDEREGDGKGLVYSKGVSTGKGLSHSIPTHDLYIGRNPLYVY